MLKLFFDMRRRGGGGGGGGGGGKVGEGVEDEGEEGGELVT